MKIKPMLEHLSVTHMALELQAALLDEFEFDSIELKLQKPGVITLELMNDYFITIDTNPEKIATGWIIVLAHRGETALQLQVGYKGERRGGKQVIASFSTVKETLTWIKQWHKNITGLTEALAPPDKRAMLYFQTRALEYDTGQHFDVEAELVNGDPPMLKIRFPEHYEYDIDVTFINHQGVPRISAVIDDRNSDGGKVTYIMLKLPDYVAVIVDGGLLSDGSSSKDCPSWEAAIDFFMREVDGRIRDIWATPGSAS